MITSATWWMLPAFLIAATPGPPSSPPARRRLPIPLLTLAIGMALLGWLDPFHVAVAAITVLTAKVLALLAPATNIFENHPPGRIERSANGTLDLADTPGTSVRTESIRAVLRGALLLAVVVLISWLASLIPGLQALVLDRDRTAMELKLEALEDAGNWSAAADLISLRLERRASREWQQALRIRLYDSLIAAGVAVSDQEAESYFQRAYDLAEQHALNKNLAATHLERLNLRGAYDQEKQTAMDLARKATQRETELKRITGKVATYESTRAEIQNRLDAKEDDIRRLQAEITKAHASQNTVEANHLRSEFQMLIEWGDSLPSSDSLRKAKYQTAQLLAQQHGLDATPLNARLVALEQAIAKAQPVSLPSGTRATLHRLDFNTFRPLVIIDLSVHLPTGQTLPGLASKDFRLHAGTTSQGPLLVGSLTTQAQPVTVVLLFDHSASTAGAANTAAKAGAAALLKQLQGVARIKIIAFASRVAMLNKNWSDDLPAVSAALDQLTPSGNTALRQALAQALDDLRGCEGPKAVVLFTDGRDTVGGPAIDDLTTRFRKGGVVVHAVALETAELDREFLIQLTQATGGAILPAAKVQELPQRFRDAAEALRAPYYRLVFADKPTDNDWEIIVGGKNPQQITVGPATAKHQATKQE